jgi:L-alanine-DL-glutamate epimerase-like enolase superfamily enzyme
LIDTHLKLVLLNQDAMNVSLLWNKMISSIRNLGRPGICSMAIAAIDFALWDLKAKIIKLPLINLLGCSKEMIPVYGSGGFTNYSDQQMIDQFTGWVEMGITMMKMKIGRNFHDDKKRIKLAREIIGDQAELFIDANGAYKANEALEMAEYAFNYDVKWFEEPVISDDLNGLSFIRNKVQAGLTIAAGEYGYDGIYFRRMLEAQAVDVLQIDATRCAGITGFLEAAAISKLFNIPNSAHTAPAIHIAPCCASDNVIHIEYFHDHARIEKSLIEGVSLPEKGCLTPIFDAMGSGLEFKFQDAEKFQIVF